MRFAGELKQKEAELAEAKKAHADAAKTMVGAVARDIYAKVTSTSEMNIVLSAKKSVRRYRESPKAQPG